MISSNALRFCLFSVIFGIVRNLLKFLTNLFQIVLGFENFTSLWLSFLRYEVFKVRGTFLQVPSLAAFAVSDIYSTIALLHCQYLFTFFCKSFYIDFALFLGPLFLRFEVPCFATAWLSYHLLLYLSTGFYNKTKKYLLIWFLISLYKNIRPHISQSRSDI